MIVDNMRMHEQTAAVAVMVAKRASARETAKACLGGGRGAAGSVTGFVLPRLRATRVEET